LMSIKWQTQIKHLLDSQIKNENNKPNHPSIPSLVRRGRRTK
jgi:hypothetical protein